MLELDDVWVVHGLEDLGLRFEAFDILLCHITAPNSLRVTRVRYFDGDFLLGAHVDGPVHFR